jgi:hypothetical protein
MHAWRAVRRYGRDVGDADAKQFLTASRQFRRRICELAPSGHY